MTFTIEKNGKPVTAEVLTVVTLKGKEYLVYSTGNSDGSFDIDACYIRQDAAGYDIPVPIQNAADYACIKAWVGEQLDEARAQTEDRGGCAGNWMENDFRTPLSPAESLNLALETEQLYRSWSQDHTADHSWLCIALERDRLVFKQLPAGQQTRYYTHSLSCQQDREDLAAVILQHLQECFPGCRPYLDYSSLILPTN